MNVSRAAEAGVHEAVRSARVAAWRRENAGAIAEYNAWVEAHGVPLAEHRKF